MTDSVPRHPGKILFDQVMTPLGVSRNKLARDIDVPVGRISDVVAGKRGVTPDTALRFAKYFGTTAELWLRLQADYDLYVARTTSWQDAEPKVAVFAPVQGESAPHAVAVSDQAANSGVDADLPPSRSIETENFVKDLADENVSDVAEVSIDEDEEHGLPSEIELDDGNIDIPEPAGLGRPRADDA